MKSSLTFLLLSVLIPLQVHAQERIIHFPDVAPYQTLIADLHMHTAFSDGSVWPNIRVQEAHRDGLDAIAITDHLEYLPHEADIPFPDRNRSYEVARNANGNNSLIVINGAEVTRSMPPGHVNAIFLEDATRLKLLAEEPPEVALREAHRQDAFIFWNHPNWLAQRSTGIAELDSLHEALIAEGLLHGIEVVNEGTFSEEALAIALAHNLTVLATSDIHGLVDWQFDVPGGGHRPATLVFASEHSKTAFKEALEARRTVAYFKHNLIGREEMLMPLLEASLVVTEAQYVLGTQVLSVTIANKTSTPFTLRNTSAYSLHEHTDLVTAPPHGELTLRVKTRERLPQVALAFEVLNAHTAPGTNPTLHLTIPL